MDATRLSLCQTNPDFSAARSSESCRRPLFARPPPFHRGNSSIDYWIFRVGVVCFPFAYTLYLCTECTSGWTAFDSTAASLHLIRYAEHDKKCSQALRLSSSKRRSLSSCCAFPEHPLLPEGPSPALSLQEKSPARTRRTTSLPPDHRCRSCTSLWPSRRLVGRGIVVIHLN